MELALDWTPNTNHTGMAEEEILTDVDGEVIPADELHVDSLYTNELLSTTDR